MFIFSLLLLVLWGAYLPASAQEARSAVTSEAKKEGKVVFYTTMSLPEVQSLSAIFEKQYPPIGVEVFRLGSGGITNRVQAKFNAKSDLVDVIQGVANRAMVPLFRERDIIERYVSPEFKYIPDDLRDQEGYWTSVYRSATFPRAPTWIPTHWSYSKGFSASSSSKICRIFPRWSDYITIRWG